MLSLLRFSQRLFFCALSRAHFFSGHVQCDKEGGLFSNHKQKRNLVPESRSGSLQDQHPEVKPALKLYNTQSTFPQQMTSSVIDVLKG